jgi:hypothetical protein
LRHFQSLINIKYPNYSPPELIDWKERQDESLQNEGRRLGVSIEKKMKTLILENLEILFEDTWELEINSIKRECQDRAEKEMERFYKVFKKKKTVDWTEMFNINDYKSIIEKYWTTYPEIPDPEFKSFQKLFALDMALRVKLGYAKNIDTPFPPFAIDNNRNVRGSGNLVQRGSALWVINSEYRQSLFERKWFAMQANLFVDVAGIRPSGYALKDLFKNKNAHAYNGIGIRFIHKYIYNAVFRIDYGFSLGKVDQQGIVFGIGQYF